MLQLFAFSAGVAVVAQLVSSLLRVAVGIHLFLQQHVFEELFAEHSKDFLGAAKKFGSHLFQFCHLSSLFEQAHDSVFSLFNQVFASVFAVVCNVGFPLPSVDRLLLQPLDFQVRVEELEDFLLVSVPLLLLSVGELTLEAASQRNEFEVVGGDDHRNVAEDCPDVCSAYGGVPLAVLLADTDIFYFYHLSELD